MRTAYFDCFNGAAGDMLLASLLDAGCPVEVLQTVRDRLGLKELTFTPERTQRGGISCMYLRVNVAGVDGGGATFRAPAEKHSPHSPPHTHSHPHSHEQSHDHAHRHAHGHTHSHGHKHDHLHDHAHSHEHAHPHAHEHGHTHSHAGGDHPHRHLPEILKLIEGSGLPAAVIERAGAIFRRLAEAEAAVHGCDINHVHFHEVGAADAIFDICGVVAALDALGIERIECSPLPPGSGTVTCDHGVMPVPAPATAQLLRGVPLAPSDEPGELVTPTGAAILRVLAESFGPPPALRLERVGYGAGTRPGKTRPNFLRVLIGDLAPPAGRTAAPGDAACAEALQNGTESDEVVVLETQLDDVTGQTLGHTLERLFEAGALDAFIVPILMKKGRPGHLVTVLSDSANADRLTALLLAETPTFGVRRTTASRTRLARAHVSVATPYGPVRVKVGGRAGAWIQASPEFEDCAAAARKHGVPLRQVQAAAVAEWKRTNGDGVD